MKKATLLSIMMSTLCCFLEVKGMEPLNNNKKVENLKTTRIFFLSSAPSANNSHFATDKNMETQTNNNLPENLKRNDYTSGELLDIQNANIVKGLGLERKVQLIRAKLAQIVLDEIQHKHKSQIETSAID